MALIKCYECEKEISDKHSPVRIVAPPRKDRLWPQYSAKGALFSAGRVRFRLLIDLLGQCGASLSLECAGQDGDTRGHQSDPCDPADHLASGNHLLDQHESGNRGDPQEIHHADNEKKRH